MMSGKLFSGNHIHLIHLLSKMFVLWAFCQVLPKVDLFSKVVQCAYEVIIHYKLLIFSFL